MKFPFKKTNSKKKSSPEEEALFAKIYKTLAASETNRLHCIEYLKTEQTIVKKRINELTINMATLVAGIMGAVAALANKSSDSKSIILVLSSWLLLFLLILLYDTYVLWKIRNLESKREQNHINNKDVGIVLSDLQTASKFMGALKYMIIATSVVATFYIVFQ